jgi:hypothetical protein
MPGETPTKSPQKGLLDCNTPTGAAELQAATPASMIEHVF